MAEYSAIHPVSDTKSGEYYLIERQFTADDWHWWGEKHDVNTATEYVIRCRELLPNDIFRLVKVERTILEV